MLTEEQIEQLGVTHESYGYRGSNHAPPTHTFYPKDLLSFARAIEQAVRQEMAVDREDAERYRWLVDTWGASICFQLFGIEGPVHHDEELDSAIDQARKAPAAAIGEKGK